MGYSDRRTRWRRSRQTERLMRRHRTPWHRPLRPAPRLLLPWALAPRTRLRRLPPQCANHPSSSYANRTRSFRDRRAHCSVWNSTTPSASTRYNSSSTSILYWSRLYIIIPFCQCCWRILVISTYSCGHGYEIDRKTANHGCWTGCDDSCEFPAILRWLYSNLVGKYHASRKA